MSLAYQPQYFGMTVFAINHDLCVLTCRNIIILLFDALLKT